MHQSAFQSACEHENSKIEDPLTESSADINILRFNIFIRVPKARDGVTKEERRIELLPVGPGQETPDTR